MLIIFYVFVRKLLVYTVKIRQNICKNMEIYIKFFCEQKNDTFLYLLCHNNLGFDIIFNFLSAKRRKQ